MQIVWKRGGVEIDRRTTEGDSESNLHVITRWIEGGFGEECGDTISFENAPMTKTINALRSRARLAWEGRR